MSRPSLYLSYGMPKSGSTLAFEITRTMLELAGVPQDKIAADEADREHGINFVSRLDGPCYRVVEKAAAARGGPVAIKTHSRLFPKIEKELAGGLVIGHAVCRDPRDMALSMMDAAREGRAWGGINGEPIRSVLEVKKRLHKSIGIFEKWAATPNVLPVYYERLAFDTVTVASEIAAQIGIEVDIQKVIEIATGSRFTQFNQGKPQRWKSEMAPADARVLENEFKEFIGKYCQQAPSNPVRRKPPSGLLGKLFRRKR